MVSRDTKLTAAFVVLATALWLVAQQFTTDSWVLWAVLVGVGVVVPTVLNEVSD
ncbi:hypothetical protein SAMN04487947_0693 [Halogeometricum rufum]|jgi:hypothetical protein|uniref:Uncharacterized protein n=1 Tax=Halogeometricum rufum TaxID=553469 RepID=A0A1I6G7S6_9EURY|nr:hypothetical protein [Halogeometricum rufum]SFR38190.1 hypothetical protein SAMN04487947_0693 [Halogeometricum rufum]